MHADRIERAVFHFVAQSSNLSGGCGVPFADLREALEACSVAQVHEATSRLEKDGLVVRYHRHLFLSRAAHRLSELVSLPL